MLLEDERHVIKWLSQYGALTKTQVIRLLRDKSPDTAAKILRNLKREHQITDIAGGYYLAVDTHTLSLKPLTAMTNKETENETPDIYCEFEPPVLPCEVKELEAVFSDLYEEPKTVEDIIFDYVIMAPEMIRPLDDLHTTRGRVTIYLLTEDWAVNGEQESNCEAFTDYDDARRILTDRLCQELDEGGVPQWKVSENFKEFSAQDCYEAYLEGEYIENHYKIMIVRQSLCVSPRFLRETQAVQQSAVKDGVQ